MTCPCLACDRITPEKRYPGCHSVCEEHLNWKAEHEERNDKIRQKKYIDNITYEIRQERFTTIVAEKRRET